MPKDTETRTGTALPAREDIEYFGLEIPKDSEGAEAIRGFLDEHLIGLVGPEQDTWHVTVSYFGKGADADRSLVPENDDLGKGVCLRVIGYGEYKDDDGNVLNQGLLVELDSLGPYAGVAQNGVNSHVTLAIDTGRGAKAVDTAECDWTMLDDSELFTVGAVAAAFVGHDAYTEIAGNGHVPLSVPETYREILDRYIGDRPEGQREFTVLVGPTNSGKTHAALDELSKAESGAYLGPLRLLASEVYTELNQERGVPCSLLTGEERRDAEGARHVASTVEMLNTNTHYDVVVIDEAQNLGDPDRGGAVLRAIAGADADRVIVCCAPETESLVRDLVEVCGDRIADVRHLDRMSPMECDGNIGFDDIKAGDAVVCFSVRELNDIADSLEENGVSVSRIYGAMPYELRIKEQERFISGKTDVIVSTDAIGMGLNLPIERVVLAEMKKFDGYGTRYLTSAEVRQIAGRAGRGTETGHYAAWGWLPDFVQSKYETDPIQLRQAYVSIPPSMFTEGEYVSDVYRRFDGAENDRDSLLVNGDAREKAELAEILEYDVWRAVNGDDAVHEFFDAAENAGYWDDESYLTEWEMARGDDGIRPEGMIDTRGMAGDLIRRFSEFPISTKDGEVVRKWEALFMHEFTGEPLGVSVYEFCHDCEGRNEDPEQMEKRDLESKVKVCDMVSYYEQRFGTEKGYQEARQCRKEYVEEMAGRLDAEDEANGRDAKAEIAGKDDAADMAPEEREDLPEGLADGIIADAEAMLNEQWAEETADADGKQDGKAAVAAENTADLSGAETDAADMAPEEREDGAVTAGEGDGVGEEEEDDGGSVDIG